MIQVFNNHNNFKDKDSKILHQVNIRKIQVNNQVNIHKIQVYTHAILKILDKIQAFLLNLPVQSLKDHNNHKDHKNHVITPSHFNNNLSLE